MFYSLLQEHLGLKFPGSFVLGGLQHLQLAPKIRRRIHEAITQIDHSAHGSSVLPMFDDAHMTRGEPFDDALSLHFDPRRPIVSVMIIYGPGIDGIV